MKRIVSAIAAFSLCFGAMSALAAVPQVPEDASSIYIANGGLYKINKTNGAVSPLLEETPRDVYVKDGNIYCVMARELPETSEWIDSAYRLNTDGTVDELLSGDADVDVFRMNDDFWYYTTYDADVETSTVFKENSESFTVNGRVMDIDWKNYIAYSYRTITDGDNPHREVMSKDIAGCEEEVYTEDFDYPEYIYNYCVNGRLFSKTYYDNTAYLYSRTANSMVREQLLEDFLDYAVSDDARYIYYSRDNGTAVEVLRYDLETKETVTIIDSTDDFAMVEDCIYSFNANHHEIYTLDGELIGSAALGGAESVNTLELTIGSDSMLVNGQMQQLNQPPVIISDRTMVPVRAITEGLGGAVEWDGETRTVSIDKDGKRIEIVIDSDIAKVNGADVPLDAPAVIENETTLVPIRFISEEFGCNVGWNGETQTVTIVSEVN